jgi:hypothetical protein
MELISGRQIGGYFCSFGSQVAALTPRLRGQQPPT